MRFRDRCPYRYNSSGLPKTIQVISLQNFKYQMVGKQVTYSMDNHIVSGYITGLCILKCGITYPGYPIVIRYKFNFTKCRKADKYGQWLCR